MIWCFICLAKSNYFPLYIYILFFLWVYETYFWFPKSLWKEFCNSTLRNFFFGKKCLAVCHLVNWMSFVSFILQSKQTSDIFSVSKFISAILYVFFFKLTAADKTFSQKVKKVTWKQSNHFTYSINRSEQWNNCPVNTNYFGIFFVYLFWKLFR